MFMISLLKIQIIDNQCLCFCAHGKGAFLNTRFSKVERLAGLADLYVIQILTKSFL